MTESDRHCLELVQSADRDRFLASLFAPDDKRPHLLALHAFAAEIARIPALVSEPQLGLIRLQWWRDTLDGLAAGDAPAHPVAEALGRAVTACGLPLQPLHELVTAHEFDLYSDKVQSLTELEAYLGETQSAVIQLAALILSGPEARGAATAAGFAGVAYGLAKRLSRPETREKYLPPGFDLSQAVAHARKRLDEARAAAASLPPLALPAFLPIAVTPLLLRQIERRPDHPSEVSQLRRQLTMWWAARRDKF